MGFFGWAIKIRPKICWRHLFGNKYSHHSPGYHFGSGWSNSKNVHHRSTKTINYHIADVAKSWFDCITFQSASPLWRNSGGRRRFRVTIGRLVVGSIPGRDLRERNFGGAQNHNKEWWEWDDNACTLTIGAWHNSLDRRPPWYLVSPLLKTKTKQTIHTSH